MKRINFICAIALLFCGLQVALAEPLPKTLYCPEKIECSRDKITSSCKVIGNHTEFWGGIIPSGAIIKGDYHLKIALSTYQSPLLYRNPSCHYASMNNLKHQISLSIKDVDGSGVVYWEPAVIDSAQWEESHGYNMHCGSVVFDNFIDYKKCPLQMEPLLKIFYPEKSKINNINLYANGVLIDDKASRYEQRYNWKAISMYQAWEACSDQGICNIEMFTKINDVPIYLGAVIVDMDNKMKIIDLYPDSGYEILIKDLSNSIIIRELSSN